MSMPTKPGTYIGFARSAAVEQREGKCPRWIAQFQLGQFFNGTEWEPLDGDVSFTGYFTLINTNGQPNEINCQAIIDAYDLPQFDFKTLEAHDFTGTEVQLVLDYRDYMKDGVNKRILDVKYLNRRDFQRQTLASDPHVVQSLDQKYGALLRAKFKPKPGATANGHHKPANGTASPPAALKPAGDPVEAAKAVAWAAFKAKAPAGIPISERNEKWTQTVRGYAGKSAGDLTAEDWATVTTEINANGMYNPKAAEPVAAGGAPINEDDIPF